jgi:arginyl-tRNA synthetase
LDGIIQSLERIDVFIDSFVWESELIDEGVVNDVIKKLKTSSHYKEEDGVGYIEMEDFGVSGMDTRFFITRKDGTSLYATRDIAYHLSKSQHYDKVIDVLGEDHKFQTRKVEVGLKLLGVKKLPEIIFYAFVSLPEGKMATRKGRVVWLDDLIDEAVKRAHNEVKKRRAGLPEEKMMGIAHKRKKRSCSDGKMP